MMLLPLCLSFALAQDPQPAQPGTLVLCTYEIRDLLPKLAAPDAAAGELRQLGYVGGDVDPRAKELAQQREAAVAFLSATLAAEVQPPTQSGQWTLRVTPNGTLVLHATLEQQQWVRGFLERIRAHEPSVVFETTWIEGPKGAYQRMGIPSGTSASVIDEKDRARLLDLGKDDKRFEVQQRPSLQLQPLARGTLSIGTQMAYVKNYKLETVQPGNAQIADPEIGSVTEGLELQALALVLDGGKVALDVNASTTAVRRPIPTKNVRLAPEIPTEVTIAMPEIDRKSFQARCTLGAEGTVAFCVPVAGKDDRELLILARARAATASAKR